MESMINSTQLINQIKRTLTGACVKLRPDSHADLRLIQRLDYGVSVCSEWTCCPSLVTWTHGKQLILLESYRKLTLFFVEGNKHLKFNRREFYSEILWSFHRLSSQENNRGRSSLNGVSLSVTFYRWLTFRGPDKTPITQSTVNNIRGTRDQSIWNKHVQNNQKSKPAAQLNLTHVRVKQRHEPEPGPNSVSHPGYR